MIDKSKYTKKKLTEITDSIGMIIDSREQKPFAIIEWLDRHSIPYKIEQIKYGDYSFYIPENEELDIHGDIDFDEEIVFERKNSVDELIGNFVKRDRIETEFKNKKAEMYLLIEGKYKDLYDGNYRSDYPKESATATYHSFIDRYDLKPVWVSAEYTPKFMYKTFKYHLRNKLK